MFLGGFIVSATGSEGSGVELGALPLILGIIASGSSIGALYLMRTQRKKLGEESATLAEQRLIRTFEQQEKVWERQLEFAERNLARKELELASAVKDRDSLEQEVKRWKRKYEEAEKELARAQERLIIIRTTLAHRAKEDPSMDPDPPPPKPPTPPHGELP